MSGFTSNSLNSEGAQIIDFLYSESSGTDRKSILKQQTLRLIRKSINMRRASQLESNSNSNKVIDMLSDNETPLDTVTNRNNEKTIEREKEKDTTNRTSF